MEPLVTQNLSDSLLGVPFEQKWELLKPTIERLYVHENWKLPDVVKFIKEHCSFDATDTQYKYQIKKWKLKKNTSTPKKAALYKVIQNRAQLGKSSVVTRGGQNVDTKNLRRYLKTEARRALTLQPASGRAATDIGFFSGRTAQFGMRIFMNWNMPYGATRSSAAIPVDHVSPPSDTVVTTPSSAHDAPSPMAMALKTIAATDRARLFVEGRHNDLLRSLDKHQRVTMSTWMYQFWLFSFRTAKHWGRGPQDWTTEILGFDNYHQRRIISISLPNTPGVDMGTPASQSNPGEDRTNDPAAMNDGKRPSSLCRWSIHYDNVHYEQVPSPPRSPPRNLDLDDEKSWPAWPNSYVPKDFTEKLADSLESNDFSNVSLYDLPIAMKHVAKAARRSSDELLREALGFSIMGRNVELMEKLLEEIGEGLDASGLYPFHLAASYVDGSKHCCSILDGIMSFHPSSLRKLYVNDLGHTVLDQLMTAILKAHTSCLPSVVDDVFKHEKRFEGEDVDICGRWDADSDCIRVLVANGTAGIPFEWKHMFCHTSVQTICHSIGTVFGPTWGPDINEPSGLFVRRCSHCGLKLQLLPLHTLILVGLHLSRSGCKGENLFGILACLMCVLSNGANPLLMANISSQALLGDEEVNECSHERLDPAELAERMLTSLTPMLPSELRTSWEVIRHVLRHSQAVWETGHSQRRSTSRETERDDESETSENSEDEMSIDSEENQRHRVPAECSDCEYYDNHVDFFGGSELLATLWAAIQTELLTYRRLEVGDEWISQNFNMDALSESLSNHGNVAIALVQEDMMKPFNACGRFRYAIKACPIVDDAATYYFSNLNDWERTTFLQSPSHRIDTWNQ